ncbi:CpaF family protein [Sinanaerobacter chloroacetimidivorans]|jgi:pilus assembly protein CpaF|uniref:CpaF family protein n=1 Tax=Sinanaerobacter chloroacetimidivorans TaxID=2818044 RepID=A0A8J7W345_9FIRM|nr:CpaF family protein [Sinanaerobacter chloroacetimidivorans]MBR0600012.1 CpaF family protein [Sinanaerobacter chloroacetimidivorans]
MSLLERLEKQKSATAVPDPEHSGSSISGAGGTEIFHDEYAELKEIIHKEIIEQINLEASGGIPSEENQEEYLLKTLEMLIDEKPVSISRADRSRLIRELYHIVAGLGPLEPLLDDPEITEIMVNGPWQVYIERRGKIELSTAKFKDHAHVMHVINRIVSSVGRHIDEASPMVDARLDDGSRFNAIIPPLALNGPTITIRKFSKKPFTVNDLIRFTSVSPKMMSFLEACVKGRMNIIVSGGTGSGKTTLLNVLSGFIPNTERIVTIEDAAELQLRQDHVVTLESRPPNLEGAGQVTIRDLVRNSLRMRPDRIIVGEVRSEETLDMLQAMNTGHEGSLTTAHANSPRELMSRLETMVLMAGMELPVKAIREQISSAIDIVVHQSRLKDGSRKVVNITEIVGMEGDTITLQDIFYFKPEGLDASGKLTGNFYSTGIRPSFLEKIASCGVLVKDDWFMN